MSRLTATDRLRRLLAVIPWVSEQGSVPLAEIAERFDYPLERLRRDLTEVVQFVGVYPYTPDMMIEVVFDGDDEHVSFALADYFAAPLQLTPEEGLRLVSAGLGLVGSRVGEGDALERGLAKIARRFDVEIGTELDVSLGAGDPDVLAALRTGAADGRAVRISYYSLHRSETTDRVVEPHHVFSRDGAWYVTGFCRLAEDRRTFRVDRILGLEALDDPFEPSGDAGDKVSNFAASEDDVRVTLRLAPAAGWVSEAYPVEAAVFEDDGSSLVTMAVSSRAWLARLLLQLGPDATLIDATPDLGGGLRAAAAERILANYR